MLNETCHDCDGCEHFRRVEMKGVPTWTLDTSEVIIEVPICTRIIGTLAIRKCDCFEATELRKKMTGHVYKDKE